MLRLGTLLGMAAAAHVRPQHALPSGTMDIDAHPGVVRAAALDERSPSNRQLVLKGERHTSTHFLRSILNKAFGSNACMPSDTKLQQDTGQCAACDMTIADPHVNYTEHAYCCWKHGYADANCNCWTKSPGGYPAHAFIVRSIYPWMVSMSSDPYEYECAQPPPPPASPGWTLVGSPPPSSPPPPIPFPPKNSPPGLPPSPIEGHCPPALCEFATRPFAYTPVPYKFAKTDQRESRDNPVKLWNAKVRSYLGFNASAKARSVFITHEALYDLPRLQESLKPLLKDEGIGEPYVLYNCSGKDASNASSIEYPPMGLYDNKWLNQYSQKTFDDARAYETERHWLEHLSPADIEFINANVDWEIMNAFGFARVESCEARGAPCAPPHALPSAVGIMMT